MAGHKRRGANGRARKPAAESDSEDSLDEHSGALDDAGFKREAADGWRPAARSVDLKSRTPNRRAEIVACRGAFAQCPPRVCVR